MIAQKGDDCNPICHFISFGLIVTGKTEKEHLPKLFKSLMKTGFCSFEVIHFVGQRSSVTSEKRKIEMVGRKQIIPDKDENLGMMARRYLKNDICHFVILIVIWKVVDVNMPDRYLSDIAWHSTLY